MTAPVGPPLGGAKRVLFDAAKQRVSSAVSEKKEDLHAVIDMARHVAHPILFLIKGQYEEHENLLCYVHINGFPVK